MGRSALLLIRIYGRADARRLRFKSAIFSNWDEGAEGCAVTVPRY